MTLTNKQIAITRDLRKAAEFAQLLHERGAVPLIYPCIEIVAPKVTSELDSAIGRLLEGEFNWLIFSSQNAVEAIASRIETLGFSNYLAKVVNCCAVGPATADAAKLAFGFDEVSVPDVYNAASLAKIFKGLRGKQVLFPKSQIARTTILELLEKEGAFVCSPVAYDTKIARGGVELPELVKKGEVDAITFASPSAVRFFGDRFFAEGGSHEDLQSVCIACIGDVTQEAAKKSGLKVDVVPGEHTLERLVRAMEDYFNKDP